MIFIRQSFISINSGGTISHVGPDHGGFATFGIFCLHFCHSWLRPLISHWLLMSAESSRPIRDVFSKYRPQTIEINLNSISISTLIPRSEPLFQRILSFSNAHEAEFVCLDVRFNVSTKISITNCVFVN